MQSGVCPEANSSTATVTVNANNTVTVPSSTPTLCISTPLTPLLTLLPEQLVSALLQDCPQGNCKLDLYYNYNRYTNCAPERLTTYPSHRRCGTVNATGTITVTPDNTIILSSADGTDAQIVCINTPITPITYATTGVTGATITGLPAGVTGSWAGNVVTISGTPTSAIGSPFYYIITLTGGCGNITANGSITVTPDNTITLSSADGTDAQMVCINTPITPITYATTGATGATITGLPAGVTGSWAGMW
ncbi:MAG: hypothetical protein IPI37_08140 [Bacteroidales bacterium]|nr:hypothetical protein [Bacteroidales bacterium]